MQYLSLGDEVLNSAITDEPIVLKPNLHKPKAWVDWFEDAWENLFKTIYGVQLRLKIGEDQFEYSSDFIVCRNTNRILNTIPTLSTEKNLKMCFIGDLFGGTTVLGMAGLVPDLACIVSFQNETDNTRLRMNMNHFLNIASQQLSEKEKDHKYLNTHVIIEPQNFDEYEKENVKTKILQGPCSLHNRLPWEFMKWCPENFIFDVIQFEVPWNLNVQKQMLALKEKMDKRSKEENFNMTFKSFEDDLKFYEHEASHFDTFKNIDSFFLCDMQKRHIRSKFIVVNIRGRLSAEDWERLHNSGSLLTRQYKVRYQIEQFPNERIERLRYNYETKEFEKIIEKLDLEGKTPMREAKDKNGGIRGQIMVVILEESGSGSFHDLESTCTHVPYKELYEKWYGTYMNTRDSAKRGLFVDKGTHELLCKRIQKGPSKVRIFSEGVRGRSNIDNKNDFTVIPARKRRIEVQIEDLKSLLHECKVFVQELKSGISIPPQRYKTMMHFISHGEYAYKYNDCCISQADKTDTEERKQFGEELIHQKTLLFHEVHHIMKAIEKHCHWEMEAVVKHPDKYEPLDVVPRKRKLLAVVPHTYKRSQTVSNMKDSIVNKKQIGCMMNSIPQSSIESKPITIGGNAYCYDADYNSDDYYEDIFEFDDDNSPRGRDDDEYVDREDQFQNAYEDRYAKNQNAKSQRQGWGQGGSSAARDKRGNGNTDTRGGNYSDPSDDKGYGGTVFERPTKTAPVKDSQGFEKVRHKNGRAEAIDRAAFEKAKEDFKKSQDGYWFEKIRNMGFKPKDVPGFGDGCSWEQLFKNACDEMAKREKSDPDFYYTHQLTEMGIDPQQIHIWRTQHVNLKEKFFRLKEKEYKEFEEEKIKKKEEEKEKKRLAEKEALLAVNTPESEEYYKNLCIEYGVALNSDEYKDMKNFKEIYLMVAKKHQMIIIPYNPKKNSKKHDENTTSHHEPEEIRPEPQNWVTGPRENMWSKGKGNTHEKKPESGVLPKEHESELPTKRTHNHGPKSHGVEDKPKEKLTYNFIDYGDRHEDKDFISFINHFKEVMKTQKEDPYSAWRKYKEEKKYQNSVKSAQNKSFDEHEVRAPDFVAECKWFARFDDFVYNNLDKFEFKTKQDAFDTFIKYAEIDRTLQLWELDGETIVRRTYVEGKHGWKIIDLINKIRHDEKFQNWARYFDRDAFLPCGLKWYENVEDFFGYNFEYFEFDNADDARDFAGNIGWRCTEELWPGGEVDFMVTASGITRGHAEYIAGYIEHVLFYDKKFQQKLKRKWGDKYKEPEKIENQ